MSSVRRRSEHRAGNTVKTAPQGNGGGNLRSRRRDREKPQTVLGRRKATTKGNGGKKVFGNIGLIIALPFIIFLFFVAAAFFTLHESR